MKKKKVFITGGAGFIGTNLLLGLEKENFKITVYDNLSNSTKKFFSILKRRDIKFIKGNILNFKLLNKSIKGHDLIIHLSANSQIQFGFDNPKIDFQNGTYATFNILEAMRINNIKKIIYTSGSGVYGDRGNVLINEKFIFNPNSLYGASKSSSEHYIRSYVEMYKIRALIFRPANIVGPYMTHGVIFDLLNKLKKNQKLLKVLGNGTQLKSYMHVNDLVNLIINIIKKNNYFYYSFFKVFNISNNSYCSVKKIVNLISSLTKIKFKTSYGRLNIGWMGDVPKVKLNIKKIQNELKWLPKYNSTEAVKDAIKSLIQKRV